MCSGHEYAALKGIQVKNDESGGNPCPKIHPRPMPQSQVRPAKLFLRRKSWTKAWMNVNKMAENPGQKKKLPSRSQVLSPSSSSSSFLAVLVFGNLPGHF